MRAIYFAYGSNMDAEQIRDRCPSVKRIGIGELKSYRLCFPRWSNKRKHAVASIEPSTDDSVWGVLFEFNDVDLRALDRKEGFRGQGHSDNAYRRDKVTVDSGGSKVAAQTYLAELNSDHPDPGLPSSNYLKQIIDGATRYGLPEAYVSCLKRIETSN